MKKHSDILAEMNECYCIAPISGKVRIITFEEVRGRKVAVFYGPDDFKLLHRHRRVGGKELGDWWIRHAHRRQYSGLVFSPGDPPEIDGRLNLWQGFGIEPCRGDWSLMRKHIKEVIARNIQKYADYTENWIAWKLQHPGEPTETALVLRGKRGTGKGIFARSIKQMYGQHGLQISHVKYLTGTFNKHLMDCALLFADEAFWPGDKSGEGELKRIITEDTLTIHPKHVDAFEVKNCLALVMASNSDWVVPAGLDERRFAVFDMNDEYMQDRDYFKPLYEEVENGGIAAMMHDLMQRDLGTWHPRDNVPQTRALREQQLRSLKPEDQWWLDMLQNAELPDAVGNNPRRSPSASLYDYARKTVPGLKHSSNSALGRYLRTRGCRDFGGNMRGWEFPSLKQAREEFELHVNWGIKASEWGAKTVEVED